MLATTVLAAQDVETHSCAYMNGFGEIQYQIQFSLRLKNKVPESIQFVHGTFVSEPLIHRRRDNGFVGDVVIVNNEIQSAYSLAANDPLFFTVSSKVVNVLRGHAALNSAPAYLQGADRFVTSLTNAETEVFVSNAYVQKHLFKQEPTKFKITLDNGPKSYLLNLQIHVDDFGYLTRAYSCIKI